MNGLRVGVVVPCYDEAARIDEGALTRLVAAADRVVFVDDGSSDGTAELLTSFCSEQGGAELLALAVNGGKAEAVRAGLRRLLAADGAALDAVGYFDADLATPVAELARLAAALADPLPDGRARHAAFASRVALLGHAIDRHLARHYLGRLYATAASVALRVPVYDTQCGAKLFRASPTLAAALADPFPDPWSFDVELLGRLLYPAPGVPAIEADEIVEVPVLAWRDVGGSKLRPVAAARSFAALVGIARRVQLRR